MSGPLDDPQLVEQLLTSSIWNPGVALAGLVVGWHANQAQKVLVGGFVAGVAGLLTLALLQVLGLGPALPMPRFVAGLFFTNFIVGLAWTFIGMKVRAWRGP